ncbi:hypothetical protein DIURU_000044 [Diutina rugosa]|uniref:Flavodoxin-like domain-containing protein n=1 Tax=Diutina rugosa TaxID=5481 RepID=A0A642UZM9_DIURU|nr:uncharacterized protein DIURU_000044 [Diutina rugosa]KAA8908731.1 hypothetical protein DIURU_000044 [Diutina rugosa]
MAPKVCVLYYSMYGHLNKLAEAVAAGVRAAGGTADIYQVPETLSDHVLELMHAPPKAKHPVASKEVLLEYDAFLFGVPTRFGNFPGQWKAFWDQTGGYWAQGKLFGKFAGVFVSTGTPGGGQEVTVVNTLSTLAHHGIVYVPLGYKNAGKYLTSFEEVHGGSPWGSGTFGGADNQRQVTELEKNLASLHGQQFYEQVSSYLK